MNRRNFIKLAATAALVPAARPVFAAEDMTVMTVYKDPNCGCCELWADAMAEAGFNVAIVKERDLMSVKKRLGVPLDIQGCHTATVGNYFFEGHVPVEPVKRLLASKDRNLVGLAVAGMPSGSLGMGDDPSASYDVLAVDKSGKISTYLGVRPKP